jgi:phosphopantothenoylcysteine decarboxylase/phosphopantothenate--cysteine ligase
MLDGVNVALGVSGSIAAVKTVELAHELRRRGASVRAVMTNSAQGIIHPWALEFATENDVVTEVTGAVEHVELCGPDGWADVLLIAPATANTVGKIASVIDDTPVTTTATTALGTGLPVVVAPAMHEPMYDHPGVLDAIEQLESWGVHVIDPRIEEGKAKIPTEDTIALAVARECGERPLDGKHVIVTSGATSESVDPIRVLTNRASGTTGRAVARACYALGADVTLVHDGPDVTYADVEHVESTAELLAAVKDHASDADALVSAAAISDYTVETAPEKLASGEPRTLELEPTPKVIDEIRDAHPDLTIVGFKTETEGTETLMTTARAMLDRVDLAFVVGNDASVMGEAETHAYIILQDDETEYIGSKAGLGERVAKELATVL